MQKEKQILELNSLLNKIASVDEGDFFGIEMKNFPDKTVFEVISNGFYASDIMDNKYRCIEGLLLAKAFRKSDRVTIKRLNDMEMLTTFEVNKYAA